jgi:hypothetical protein
MKYRVTLKQSFGGGYYARCNAAPQGPADAQGASREETLEALRREIRFRLELCPCSGVSEDFVELEVEEAPVPKGNAWR